MKYNFDSTPERRNSNSLKWTRYPADTLPFWVADMDFPAAQPILNQIREIAEHGVLGYEMPGTALKETVAARMGQLYNWAVKPEAVIAVTGTVNGFNVAARAFCSAEKGLLVQTPVYNEFHQVKTNLGIPQVDAPLVEHGHGNILRYEIDWDVFKSQVKRAGTFLLCHPHNPLGIIFSRKDLLRMAEICIENKVLIVADEIHSELLLGDEVFTPLAQLSPEIEKHTITLVSPSKTFNVAGLACGFAIISNKALRARYYEQVDHLHMYVNSIGLRVAQIAYSGNCDDWLQGVRRYLTKNRDFLVEYVTEYMPGVRITIPAATYLAWLDFSPLNLKASPFDFFMKQAKVALSAGVIFAKEYDGYVRLNFGTSQTILEQGLDRMRMALASR